ncbi:hypothetical protein LIER_33791 [Lithospermum erythrorhizon]|uniref:Uncharacterized protein n=1 Tax=Lithospermum erythrorhizon TaxID=34254 RepID=A0AAV3RZG0_LITER
MAKFWWGTSESKRKTHWMLWEKLCKPKELGGLGFRSMVHMNTALLAKQAWRLIEDRLGFVPSFAWRSILQTREVLRKGCKWVLGDGNTVRIWQDSWVLNDTVDKLVSPPPLGFEQARVIILMDIQRKKWDEDIVNLLLLPYEAELVLNMPFPDLVHLEIPCFKEDSLIEEFQIINVWA